MNKEKGSGSKLNEGEGIKERNVMTYGVGREARDYRKN